MKNFKILTFILFFLILIFGLKSYYLRYGNELLGDASGYPAIAKQTHYFYDSSTREPLTIFPVKFFLIFTTEKLAIRLPTIFATIIIFLLLFFLLFKKYGVIITVIPLIYFTTNFYQLLYGTSGINNITYEFFLLLWFFIFLYFFKNPDFKKAIILGITGGLTSLTRLEGLSVVSIMLVLSIISKFKQWKYFSISFFLPFILVSPYLIYQKNKFGSFFYSHQLHSRFWYNTEILSKNNYKIKLHRYEGGELSIKKFIFRKGLIAKMLKGYYLYFSFYVKRLCKYLDFYIFVLLGFFIALISKDKEEKNIILMLFVSLIPVSFILLLDQVDCGSKIESRFVMHTFPFLILLTSVAINFITKCFKILFLKIKKPSIIQ